MEYKKLIMDEIVSAMRQELENGNKIGPLQGDKDVPVVVYSTIIMLYLGEDTTDILDRVLSTEGIKQELMKSLGIELYQVLFNTFEFEDNDNFVVNITFSTKQEIPLI